MKGLSSKLLKLLQGLDKNGAPINLRINGDPNNKSLIGAIVTILCLLAAIALSFPTFLNVVYFTNPKITVGTEFSKMSENSTTTSINFTDSSLYLSLSFYNPINNSSSFQFNDNNYSFVEYINQLSIQCNKCNSKNKTLLMNICNSKEFSDIQLKSVSKYKSNNVLNIFKNLSFCFPNFINGTIQDLEQADNFTASNSTDSGNRNIQDSTLTIFIPVSTKKVEESGLQTNTQIRSDSVSIKVSSGDLGITAPAATLINANNPSNPNQTPQDPQQSTMQPNNPTTNTGTNNPPPNSPQSNIQPGQNGQNVQQPNPSSTQNQPSNTQQNQPTNTQQPQPTNTQQPQPTNTQQAPPTSNTSTQTQQTQPTTTSTSTQPTTSTSTQPTTSTQTQPSTSSTSTQPTTSTQTQPSTSSTSTQPTTSTSTQTQPSTSSTSTQPTTSTSTTTQPTSTNTMPKPAKIKSIEILNKNYRLLQQASTQNIQVLEYDSVMLQRLNKFRFPKILFITRGFQINPNANVNLNEPLYENTFNLNILDYRDILTGNPKAYNVFIKQSIIEITRAEYFWTKTDTITILTVDRIEENSLNSSMNLGAILSFKALSDIPKIKITFYVFSDLLSVFGSFFTTFALLASILCSLYKDASLDTNIINSVFKFIDNNEDDFKKYVYKNNGNYQMNNLNHQKNNNEFNAKYNITFTERELEFLFNNKSADSQIQNEIQLSNKVSNTEKVQNINDNEVYFYNIDNIYENKKSLKNINNLETNQIPLKEINKTKNSINDSNNKKNIMTNSVEINNIQLSLIKKNTNENGSKNNHDSKLPESNIIKGGNNPKEISVDPNIHPIEKRSSQNNVNKNSIEKDNKNLDDDMELHKKGFDEEERSLNKSKKNNINILKCQKEAFTINQEISLYQKLNKLKKRMKNRYYIGFGKAWCYKMCGFCMKGKNRNDLILTSQARLLIYWNLEISNIMKKLLEFDFLKKFVLSEKEYRLFNFTLRYLNTGNMPATLKYLKQIEDLNNRTLSQKEQNITTENEFDDV